MNKNWIGKMAMTKNRNLIICEGNKDGNHKFISFYKYQKDEIRIREECFNCDVVSFKVIRIEKEKTILKGANGNSIINEIPECFING